MKDKKRKHVYYNRNQIRMYMGDGSKESIKRSIKLLVIASNISFFLSLLCFLWSIGSEEVNLMTICKMISFMAIYNIFPLVLYIRAERSELLMYIYQAITFIGIGGMCIVCSMMIFIEELADSQVFIIGLFSLVLFTITITFTIYSNNRSLMNRRGKRDELILVVLCTISIIFTTVLMIGRQRRDEVCTAAVILQLSLAMLVVGAIGCHKYYVKLRRLENDK